MRVNAVRPLELAERWGLPGHFVDALGLTVRSITPPPVYLEDLWLSRAAAAGFARAIDELELTCIRPLRDAAGPRLEFSSDDLLQDLRERLLTGPAPRLLSYRGTGPLMLWTRAVATRLAFARGVNCSTDDAALDALASPIDVALDVARQQHHAAFQSAFSDAMRALSPGDRTLLRLRYLKGVRLERLAGMYQCHRATLVRRLGSVRDTVFSATRALLADRLNLSEPELDSLLRRGAEQLTVSRESNSQGKPG